jgi:hypothetical protein
MGWTNSRLTLGTDRAYDAEDFVNELRAMKDEGDAACGPKHQRTRLGDRRPHTTRPAGYAISRRVRKKVEEGFGWIKRPSPDRSRPGSEAANGPAGPFTFAAAAYNLARLPKLMAALT